MNDIASRVTMVLGEIEVLEVRLEEKRRCLAVIQAECGDNGHPDSAIVPITVGAVVGDNGAFEPGTGSTHGTVRCPTCRLGY